MQLSPQKSQTTTVNLYYGRQHPYQRETTIYLGRPFTIKAIKIVGRTPRLLQSQGDPNYRCFFISVVLQHCQAKGLTTLEMLPSWGHNGPPLPLLFYLESYKTAGTHMEMCHILLAENDRGGGAPSWPANKGEKIHCWAVWVVFLEWNFSMKTLTPFAQKISQKIWNKTISAIIMNQFEFKI